VMAAHRLLKAAYVTDVSPIMCEARKRKGGALHPWACYRASGYRKHKTDERPAVAGLSSGIV
jgi:L-rhamnose isomerase / sugar isomerase